MSWPRGGAAVLVLLASTPAVGAAQQALASASPREAVRTEIVAQVGAVRRLTVRPATAPSAGRDVAVQRAEVEVASNAGCLLVARGTGGVTLRLSLDGGPSSPLRAGERLVLRALPPGVHRLLVSAEGGTAPAGELPLSLELADARMMGGGA